MGEKSAFPDEPVATGFGKKQWSKKKKRTTNPSQKQARMEVTWHFITDFSDEGHCVVLRHVQDPSTAVTERMLFLDGEQVVHEVSNDCKLQLDIEPANDEVDVVIEHNAELTRYDYKLFLNDSEYAEKCGGVASRSTGGMKQT